MTREFLIVSDPNCDIVYAFAPPTCQGVIPAIFAPSSWEAQFGRYISGGLTELAESDDAYLVIEQQPAGSVVLPVIRLRVDAQSPYTTASEFTFELESLATALPATIPQTAAASCASANIAM